MLLRTLAQRCRRLSPLLAAPAALLLSQGEAKAILNVNIFDDRLNLTVTVNGSLSQRGSEIRSSNCMLSDSNGYLRGQFKVGGSLLCTGPNAIAPQYAIDGPAGYGGTGALSEANLVSVYTFRFAPSSFTGISGVRIDSSYVLGQNFLSSATFNGQSLTSQGFTATGLIGTWTLVGTSESINVFIGPPAASVPGPMPLLGAAGAFGWSRSLRKRIATPFIAPPQA